MRGAAITKTLDELGIDKERYRVLGLLPMIVGRYRLDLVPGVEPDIDAAITLRTANGMKMTVHEI